MSDVKEFDLREGQRAERKSLLTVVEWGEYTLLAAEPADWATNYNNYYTRIDTGNGYVYKKVSESSAPTFAADTYYSRADVRQLLGTRTPDSSIEYNADISTETDILGNNYTDVNKTQPQQSFDPFVILGGSRLGAKMNDIRRRNAISELNQFTAYIITGFIGNTTDGYEAERHTDCTITYDSFGGDTIVNFPITVYFSNKLTTGKVDKLGDDFVFTPDVNI